MSNDEMLELGTIYRVGKNVKDKRDGSIWVIVGSGFGAHTAFDISDFCIDLHCSDKDGINAYREDVPISWLTKFMDVIEG